MHPHKDSPENQELLASSRRRQVVSLSAREWVAELLVGGGFAAAAAALWALSPVGSVDWLGVVVAIVAFAAASTVSFEVGSTYTVPLELVFVPALFFLPPALVPLCVAVAFALVKLPEVLRGRKPADRLLPALGDSWFAIGPALVFAIAAPGAPDAHDWPIYLAALGAQFVFDFTASSIRVRLNGGSSFVEELRECRWVYGVDALLAAPGLAIAFAAAERPWIILLVLPLTGLMAIFARERRQRIDYVLELGNAYRGTALVLGEVVEADDAYTGMHSNAVVDLVVEVADELGLRGSARRNVEFGALLHDVGKITVPKAIINKPGALDDDEWAIMRRHTIEGQKMLDQIGGFMREVGVIVRASHERFGGGGYPDGLIAEEIPLEARIVCCCDAFNAMTTDRSYSAGRPVREALDELKACSGTQFDPSVVAATVAVVERRLAAEPGAFATPTMVSPQRVLVG